MIARLPLMLLVAGACSPKLPPGAIRADSIAAPVRLIERLETQGSNIYLQAIVAAGSAYDPVGNEGLANLVAQSMIAAGAGARSSQEVRDALYVTENTVVADFRDQRPTVRRARFGVQLPDSLFFFSAKQVAA